MNERLFHLVHYQDVGAVNATSSSPPPCALVWAADQHLPVGCRFVEESGVDTPLPIMSNGNSTRHPRRGKGGGRGCPADDGGGGGGGGRRDTTLSLPDEDERLWGNGQDPGEAFRCGLLWTGVRPLCAHLAQILLLPPAGDRGGREGGCRGDDDDDDGGDDDDDDDGGDDDDEDDDVWYPRRVIELGAGMGVNGIVAAQLLFRRDRHRRHHRRRHPRHRTEDCSRRPQQPRSEKAPPRSGRPLVVLTDYHTAVLDLLRRNVDMNRVDGRCEAEGDGDGDGDDCGGGAQGTPAAVRTLSRRLAWGNEADADAVMRLASSRVHEDDAPPDDDPDVDDHPSTPPPPPPPRAPSLDAPSARPRARHPTGHPTRHPTGHPTRHPPQPFDLVVAADVIYSDHVVAPLCRTLGALLRGAPPGARFLMAHTERRRLIPVSMLPGSTPGGGAGEEDEPRDEHLDLFLATAPAHGLTAREVEFERRAGEELVRLFDVRPVAMAYGYV